MKSLYITLTLALMTTVSFGQSKIVKDSINVYGNCIMCERRIETALEIPGIKLADWDYSTKKLFIAYRSDKITEDEIHQIIAKVGHDTDKAQATDSVYTQLPFCCLYREHDPHSAGDHAKEKKAHPHN